MWTTKEIVCSESSWIPPLQGMLKQSVDVYANAKPKPRIGGILRDYKENFLCIFSYSISIKEFNEAEVLTVQKAHILSTNCYYVSFKDQIAKFYSHNAITQIKGNSVMRLWQLKDDFNDMSNACLMLFYVNLTPIHRERNYVENHLF